MGRANEGASIIESHKTLEENERPEVAEYRGVNREETPSYVGVTLPIDIYEMASSFPSTPLTSPIPRMKPYTSGCRVGGAGAKAR